MNATAALETEPLNALQLFHVNFNCSNLDRSRVFYESIGFKVVNDFSQGEPQTFAEIGLAVSQIARVTPRKPSRGRAAKFSARCIIRS